MLRVKFKTCLYRRFPHEQCEQILQSCANRPALERMPVDRFVGMFAA